MDAQQQQVLRERERMRQQQIRTEVDTAIRQLHAAPLAPGFDRVFAPGELEYVTSENYRRAGIPLTDQTREDLRRTAATFEIAAAEALGKRA